MKVAARRGISRAGDFALQHLHGSLRFQARVRNWDGGNQGARVRVLRILEELFGGRQLHNPTQVHGGHLMGDMAHGGHIVRDEEVGDSQSLLNLLVVLAQPVGGYRA